MKCSRSLLAEHERADEAAVPVTEVARGLGYEDGVAFRRLSTRAVGLTPIDYRKRQCSV